MEYTKVSPSWSVALVILMSIGADLTDASKTNDVSMSDILDWTETHSTQHRLSRGQSALTIDELKRKIKRDNRLESLASRTCTEKALHRCDISAMAKLLLPDDQPCTLLKEYQFCIYRETKACNNGDARVLTTSLDNLLMGLQSNGHCTDIQTRTDPQSIPSEPSRPCGRRGVWMCTTALLEDLRDTQIDACSSLANYRHCIHIGTQPCTKKKSDALLRGTKGLARLYRKLTKQC